MPIEDARLHRFGDVPGIHRRRTLEIGQRARDAQDLAVRARGKAEALDRRPDETQTRGIWASDGFHVLRRELRIDASGDLARFVPRLLDGARLCDALSDEGGALTERARRERRNVDGRQTHVQIDAVE